MRGIWNLWLFFVLAYGIIWALMILANRKRGKAIEDPEFYQISGGKKCLTIGWIWFIVLLLICLFTPVNFGVLFWIGLPLFIISIPFYHCTVLLEEAFLEHKYRETYREFMNKTPRYIGAPKRGIGPVWYYNRPLKKGLKEKDFDIVEEFSCRGFDTVGPFKLIGGLNKDRPNEKDLEKARKFAKNLLENLHKKVKQN
ncbi:MAG: hypothetical protein Q7J55_02955 [bacterium]|nr:hypothetical protein [bacterium]